METRNVTLTLEKAKEFYNSGNEALKEVALQAFTVEELTSTDFKKIKTFWDACKALNINFGRVKVDLSTLERLEGNLGKHLTAIYKLDIIRKALNGIDWNPKIISGTIYSCWVRFYFPDHKPSDKKTIATFKVDGQKYCLVGGFGNYGCGAGLSDFYSWCEHGSSYTHLGLLCCKSQEIAEYMSEQFGKIIFDACYAQHIGSYEWVD